jgi:hypothetical protein
MIRLTLFSIPAGDKNLPLLYHSSKRTLGTGDSPSFYGE